MGISFPSHPKVEGYTDIRDDNGAGQDHKYLVLAPSPLRGGEKSLKVGARQVGVGWNGVNLSFLMRWHCR